MSGISVLTKEISGTSLKVQWLRIRLPELGTRVQSLVQEDSTLEQLRPCATTTEPAL